MLRNKGAKAGMLLISFFISASALALDFDQEIQKQEQVSFEIVETLQDDKTQVQVGEMKEQDGYSVALIPVDKK